MCGRYVATRSPQDLAQLFQAAQWPMTEALTPSWNIAPTDEVWAVLERAPRDEGGAATPVRELRALRWGLVLSWAKDPKTGARMINARVETVHEKPAYRRAFLKRRCLLPADGFYEWQPGKDPATGKVRKQPFFIHPEDGQVMALAGLYEYLDAIVLPSTYYSMMDLVNVPSPLMCQHVQRAVQDSDHRPRARLPARRHTRAASHRGSSRGAQPSQRPVNPQLSGRHPRVERVAPGGGAGCACCRSRPGWGGLGG
ncbi:MULTISPECIES: SOS response-associated peptidase [Streptomyces]|uniref:Abasic site processing protein n=1 Tax=Streptomyces flaveolus TaxID=67297 RepID=A0ABV3AQ50_9ACTN|nr:MULTISPECIES: SOS response-associated peptidase [Streptomyces]